MRFRQNIPGDRKTEKGLLHKTRNEREKCKSPYFYAFFGNFLPEKAFSICINYCVFIDPACGSGNFLTETYLSLRRLENRVISELHQGQIVFDLGSPIQVSISQFYGIEINDFAVTVNRLLALRNTSKTRNVGAYG